MERTLETTAASEESPKTILGVDDRQFRRIFIDEVRGRVWRDGLGREQMRTAHRWAAACAARLGYISPSVPPILVTGHQRHLLDLVALFEQTARAVMPQ